MLSARKMVSEMALTRQSIARYIATPANAGLAAMFNGEA
jgi:hypothetical protein